MKIDDLIDYLNKVKYEKPKYEYIYFGHRLGVEGLAGIFSISTSKEGYGVDNCFYKTCYNSQKIEDEEVNLDDYIEGIHYKIVKVKIIDIYLEVDSFGFDNKLECLVDVEPMSIIPDWAEEDEFDRVPITLLNANSDFVESYFEFKP